MGLWLVLVVLVAACDGSSSGESDAGDTATDSAADQLAQETSGADADDADLRSAPHPLGCRPFERRSGMPGDPTNDAMGTGQLFESISVPGLTDLMENTKGFSIVDRDGDGDLDLVTINDVSKQRDREQRTVLRYYTNDGCMRFSLDAWYEAPAGRHLHVPHLMDLNGDRQHDLLVTGNGVGPNTGNVLMMAGEDGLPTVEVASAFGVRNAGAYNRSSAFGDVDGNGWLDLAIAGDAVGGDAWGRPWSRFYLFAPTSTDFGDGRFIDIGGPDGEIDGFGGDFDTCDASLTKAGPDINLRDLDNDGDLDLLQTYHADMVGGDPESPCATGEQTIGLFVWRNMLAETGRFAFERVTDNGLAYEGRLQWNAASGRYQAVEQGHDAPSLPYVAMADVDNDGLLDILALGPSDPEWHPEDPRTAGRFWRNLGDMQFEEATTEVGLDAINWLYSDWGDFFDQSWPDDMMAWYTDDCSAWPIGEWFCQSSEPTDHHFYAADGVFGDFNNDGWVDLVIMDRREGPPTDGWRSVLFENQGDGSFEPVTTDVSGIDTNGMMAEAADLDGDGRLDLLFGRSPSNSSGPFEPAEHRVADVVYWNTGAQGAGQRHWLRIRVEGAPLTALMGARIEVFSTGELTSERPHLLASRVLTSRTSYKTQSPMEVHFGLGEHLAVDVRVSLINGGTIEFDNVDVDRLVSLDVDSRDVNELSR